MKVDAQCDTTVLVMVAYHTKVTIVDGCRKIFQKSAQSAAILIEYTG